MTQKIKTSINKHFSTGFVINEPDLRRIHQMMMESAAKLQDAESKQFFYVRTENGTVYEFDSIDDIFLLDNIGQKSIEFLYISIGSSIPGEKNENLEKSQEWLIGIRFEKTSGRNYSNHPSIQLDVVGPSRDWVILTASELEERIKLAQKFSPSRYLNHSASPYVAMFLMFAVFFGALMLIPQTEPVHLKLENLRTEGQIKDAIDAVIAAEKFREPSRAEKNLLFSWILVSLIAMAVLIASFPRISKFLGRPYVFLWGEYISVHQRRKTIESTVWVVVVLGLIIGVAATWISKFFGI